MFTNHAQTVWRTLLAGVALGAAGVAMLACSGSSTGQAATTEPVLHAFVGRFDDRPAFKVALLVGRKSSEAYICDNHSGSELLRGSPARQGPGGVIDLKAADGTLLEANLGARVATGTVTLSGQPAAHFTARLTTGAAGLYQATTAAADGTLLGRWIVGNDGAIVGVVRRNGLPVGNPALQQTVKVGSSTLTPAPVHRISAISATVVPIHPVYGPAYINNAFSWPCGNFYVIGGGFTPGAPVRVGVVHEFDYAFIASKSITVASDGSIFAELKFVASPTWRSDNGKNVLAIASEYPDDPTVYVQPSLYAYAC
jgi:hypothetical protein